MNRLFKINIIINLILWLSIVKLYCISISYHSKDSSSYNRKIKRLYDNPLNPYYANDQFNNVIINEKNLEEPVATKETDHSTPQATSSLDSWNTGNKLLRNSFLKLKGKYEENSCLLDSVKMALLWWSNSNGTLKETNSNVLRQNQQLDLSYHNISSEEEIVTFISDISQNMEIVTFSLAYNQLGAAPFRILQLMGNSLKYLSLMGNLFHGVTNKIGSKSFKNQHKICNGKGLAWATFPYMHSLLELDISNCGIEFIHKMAFKNLTKLKNIYMSHNKILTIPADTFQHTSSLQILDLSFTNVYDAFVTNKNTFSSLEPLMKLYFGINIEPQLFKYLPNLQYLDLSHSKLSRSSIVAFTHVGSNLKYLSLCYTSFPVLGSGILYNSSLIGLDLSGNANTVFSITEDAFEGLSESLTYLYFERANLRDLSWLKPLHNLRFLSLAGNNIKTLTAKHFDSLKQLQGLDLSSNQVSNWYTRVFLHNKNLRVLGLRDNNINIITSAMLKDFGMLLYLSLGSNNFVCDCLLRDLVDISAVNNKKAICRGKYWQDLKNSIHINSTHLAHIMQNSKLFFNTSLQNLDIASLILSQNLEKLKLPVQKLTGSYQIKARHGIRYILKDFRGFNVSKSCVHQYNFPYLHNEIINSSIFKLQLLDYEEEQYWCYNETNRQNIIVLDCPRFKLIENIEKELNILNRCIMVSLGSLILASILGVLIYSKRWYFYYYYSSIKSAVLLSVISREKLDKFRTLCKQNPNLIYDIFISYCQSDRDWIVEELIPNLEDTNDISICLHERDFEIGVTIIDNIVSCMECSKALMLIISSNFLLSHWCQFEMQLAQYHIFDLSKKHLMLVLLEDIPRSKRPKNLQFLMNIKTYIKWPGGKCKTPVQPEERKLFWKRLKHSLKNIHAATT